MATSSADSRLKTQLFFTSFISEKAMTQRVARRIANEHNASDKIGACIQLKEIRKLRRYSACALLALLVLSACDNPGKPAPEPKVNSNPHVTSQLKISVEAGSNVNNVIVRSDWVVGNIGCAPIRQPSGSPNVKQVNVDEKVKKLGSDYVATIVHDRFLPDNCHWVNGGPEIRLMHDKTLLAVTGIGVKELADSNIFEQTCIPPPHIPICDLVKKESFYRSHFSGVFNVTVEKIP